VAKLLPLLLTFGALAACPSSSAPVTPDNGPVVVIADEDPAAPAPPPADPRPAVAAAPAAPEGSAKAAADANNAFAFALYDQLRVGAGNRFVSPVSLSLALSMTSLGAAGTTEAEMRAALRLPESGAHASFGALQRELTDDRGPKTQIAIANRLWGQAGYAFQDAFLAAATKHYGAGLERVDFAASEAARATINGWVSGQTHEKIPNLIPSGLLTAQTKLVLTNAVYFKGLWAEAFAAADTKPADFFVSADKTVSAELMYRKGSFDYAEDERAQVLSMPYQGAGISMIVVLPKAKDGLAALEAGLAADLPGWLDALGGRRIEVYFPRFEMRVNTAMKAPLTALGMRTAFTQAADFSPMSGAKDLYISAVIHEAYVLVDEAGTEAAAATAVVMTRKSAAPRPAPVFRADHPFFFALRDDRSGALLFMGRVADPTAG
jgi:serpin B